MCPREREFVGVSAVEDGNRPHNGDFPRRPRGQSQFSAYMSLLEAKNRPDIGELQAWILGQPAEDLSVPVLADRMAMSPRNFSRLFP